MSNVPQALFTPAFRRIAKPLGRYQVGMAGRPLRPTQNGADVALTTMAGTGTTLQQRDALLSLVQAEVIAPAATKPAFVRAYQFQDNLLDEVLRDDKAQLETLQMPDAQGEYSRGAPTNQALENLNVAYKEVSSTVRFIAAGPVKPTLELDLVKEQVTAAADPGRVAGARMQNAVRLSPHGPASTLPGEVASTQSLPLEDAALAGTGLNRQSSPGSTGNVSIGPARVKPVMAYPVFRDAMADQLRQRHPELFIPNLENFPANGVALLRINRKFIEAFMLGVNHAFGSELLWREFPADLRGSYFRQFWNVSEYMRWSGKCGQNRVLTFERHERQPPTYQTSAL